MVMLPAVLLYSNETIWFLREEKKTIIIVEFTMETETVHRQCSSALHTVQV